MKKRKLIRNRGILKQAQAAADELLMIAAQLLGAGKYHEAIALYRKALPNTVDKAAVHNSLGVAWNALGNFEEEKKCYEKALTLAPDYAEAHYNLGNAWLRRNDPAKAGRHLEKCLRLDPNNVDARTNLGNIFKIQGQQEQALQCFQDAVQRRPDHVAALNNLGVMHDIAGNITEAIDCYKRLLQLNPYMLEALINLTVLHEKANQLNQAEQAIGKALALAPGNPGVNILAARILRRNKRPAEAHKQLSSLALSDNDPQTTMSFHFEMGTINDLLQNAAEAFRHFREGNRLRSQTREASRFSKERFLSQVDMLSHTFSRDFVTSWPASTTVEPRPEPVFLVGFPRSGTTLLDRVLRSHPQLAVIEEQPLVEGIAETVEKSAGGYPLALSTMDDETLARLRRDYLAAAGRFLAGSDCTRFVDKMPLNILHLGLIHRLFPRSKIIIALRHPLDVCLSCFMQSFEPNDAMVNFFTLEDTAHCYAQVMGLWRQYQAILPFNSYILRYEDLVENFEPEVKSLLDFLGVGWHDAVLDFHRLAGKGARINTPSYTQVCEPIYRRAKFRWKRYEKQLVPVYETLLPFVKEFGYAG